LQLKPHPLQYPNSLTIQLKPKATALFVLACLAIYDIFISPPQPILQHNFDKILSNVTTNSNNSSTSTTSHNITHFKIFDNKVVYDNKEIDEFWDYDVDSIIDQDIIEEDDLATSLRCYRGPAMLAWALFCSAYSLRVWRRNGVACDELIFLPGTPHEVRIKSSMQGEDNNNIEELGINVDELGAGDNSNLNNNESTDQISPLHACSSEGDADAAAGGATKPSPAHSRSLSSLEGLDLDSANVERQPLMIESPTEGQQPSSAPNSPAFRSRFNSEDSRLIRGSVFIRDTALKGIDMLVVRKPLRAPPLPADEELSTAGGDDSTTGTTARKELYDLEYAPSAPSVLGAAMDMSLPVIFNFHMFVILMKDFYRKEAQIEEESSSDATPRNTSRYNFTPPQVPPKILPLFFITPLIIRAVIPPRQRRRFYKTLIQGTILSPFKPVRFRDAFVADIVTSLVRPIGDILYALFYYFIAWWGLLSGKYSLNKAGYIVSESWILHGIVLPILSIVPLYIKFFQSLRQAYDTGKRWPYLGNAFKYLTAGLVVQYGMTHAAGHRNEWWIWAFFAATIYQIIWDVFIDWELLVIMPRATRHYAAGTSRIAMLCRCIRDTFEQVRFRPKRLFDDDSFYRRALFINAMLRFCWMMGFIPAYRVSVIDGSMQVTLVDKAHGWTFVLLATLEVLRRTIWGIIKVELETIKLTSEDESEPVDGSTADEYIRDGKFNVPVDALKPSIRMPRCWRSSKSGKSTLEDVTEEVMWMEEESPQQKQRYSKVEQEFTPSLEDTSSQKRKHRWLCLSVSSGFLGWMYVAELLLWPVFFIASSYYVILCE